MTRTILLLLFRQRLKYKEKVWKIGRQSPKIGCLSIVQFREPNDRLLSTHTTKDELTPYRLLKWSLISHFRGIEFSFWEVIIYHSMMTPLHVIIWGILFSFFIHSCSTVSKKQSSPLFSSFWYSFNHSIYKNNSATDCDGNARHKVQTYHVMTLFI